MADNSTFGNVDFTTLLQEALGISPAGATSIPAPHGNGQPAQPPSPVPALGGGYGGGAAPPGPQPPPDLGTGFGGGAAPPMPPAPGPEPISPAGPNLGGGFGGGAAPAPPQMPNLGTGFGGGGPTDLSAAVAPPIAGGNPVSPEFGGPPPPAPAGPVPMPAPRPLFPGDPMPGGTPAPGAGPPAAPPSGAPGMPPGGPNLNDPVMAQGEAQRALMGLRRTGQPPAGPWMSGVFGGDPRRSAQMVGSLGAGLKSVGENWNKPGLAAAAGSAGSAIEGGAAGDRKYFDEQGRALDRLQKAVNSKNAKEIGEARIDYARARFEAAQRAGTVNGRQEAYQKSEPGRFNIAEQRVQGEVESWRKLHQAGYALATPEQKVKMDADLKKVQDDARERMYKGMGLDPKKYEDYKGAGQGVFSGEGDKRKIDLDATRKRAMTPKTLNDFNATVKPGDFFINPKDGTLRQRSEAAPTPADAPGGILHQTPAEAAPQRTQQAASDFEPVGQGEEEFGEV